MGRAGKIGLGIAGVIAIAVNIVYWQDPWLWRGYIHSLSAGSDPKAVEVLKPFEAIDGGGSFVLPVAAPEARTISDEALRAAEAYAADFGSHALIVVHKGVVQDAWYAPHWSADKFTQSQSMHKTVIGLLTGIAIAEGKIGSVDDPIGQYLSEWKDDPRGKITIAQMLTMSSGLAQPPFTLNPFSEGVRWLYSGHSGDAILAEPLAGWAPGSKYDYNNFNTELLGMVLARVYAKPYSALLLEKIWRPLGAGPARVHTDSPGGRAYTSCCLGAPAMDWARVGQMLLHHGEANGRQIVPADWIAKMTTRSANSPYYGYQIWLGYEDPAGPKTGVGSSGGIASGPFIGRDTFYLVGRGQQHVFVTPSQDLVVVRLGPSQGRSPIKPGFDITYLTNTLIKGLKLEADTPK